MSQKIPKQLEALANWILLGKKVSSEEVRQREVEAIAYLLCCEFEQKQIWIALGFQRSKFHTRKKEAIKQELYVPQRYRGKRESEIQRVILEVDIQDSIRSILRSDNPFCDVRVYPSSESDPSDSKNWDAALVGFSKFAGARLVELAGKSTIFGCTWGRTVYSVAERFIDVWPCNSRRDTIVIPTWGEPLKKGEHNSDVYTKPISSTEIAVRMREVINRGQPLPATPSLLGVPAIVPMTFSDDQTKTIKELMLTADGYSAIFGKSTQTKGQIDKMDGLLTAAGAPKPRERFWSEAVLKSGGFSTKERELLFEGVIGDIGGVLLPKLDASEEQLELLTKIQNRWLGISEKHILECAKRGRIGGPPGVVLCAVGASRAETVFECLIRKMANHLLIDFHLAQRLLTIIEERNGLHGGLGQDSARQSSKANDLNS